MNDPRSAAFLEAMGLGPVWLLREAAREAAPAAQAEVEAAPVPTNRAAAPVGVESAGAAWDDASAPVLEPKPIAEMNWAELRAAIAGCTRCGACRAGVKPLAGKGPAQRVRWFVAAGATTAADETERSPLAGDAGRLLVNMLQAAGVARDEEAFVSNLIKCRPMTSNGGDRMPTAEEVAACRPFLERELVLSGARVVLTLGQIAANGLLGRALSEPLASARGAVQSVDVDGQAVPLVPTLHPGELLRRGQDKALAWADLCLARSADAPRD